MGSVVHLSSTHRLPDVRVYFKECRSLAEYGYDVSLIAPIDVGDFPAGSVHLLPARQYGNRLRRMTLGTWSVWRKALQVNADIYHIHSPELLPLGMVARLLGRRVIFDAHEDLPDQVMSKAWIPTLVRPLVSLISRIVLRSAGTVLSGVVAATGSIAEDFPSEKTVIVRNFPAEVSQSVAGAPIVERKKQVIYAGGIAEARGLTQLVEAMGIVGPRSGGHLTLAGWFIPPQYRDQLESIPGWKWVNYVGRLTREEMAEQLAASRLGIVTFLPEPNHIRSEPNKLFEYMQAGLPLLTSNFDHWKQFVTDVGTGRMVDPESSEDIAQNILWFLEHPQESARMGQTGQTLVETEFSWSSQAEKLHRFYADRILGGKE